jgi:sigma-E factor negative regulatory protein RseC
MMTTSGRVINIAGPMAQVRIEAASACSSCGTRGSCASGQTRAVWVEAPEGVKSGDVLNISISESAFNTAALIAYLLPAVTTLIGAALMATAGDTAAVLGAASGLGLGLVLVRLLGRWRATTTDFCSTERSTLTGDLT